ncbi:hypothetical protein CBR_g45798 [Chara braunii]|uniref:Uncharacterized protein n=1 Tax=Chara braunii TaxID=69332 RepID=A0A388LZE6_CHABU|nr:hypothetical protein CBR_g45798 [Chara braunii]|eukprot:GBG87645.1 hypothetical protein CBR_g45798 [Chara braunii]
MDDYPMFALLFLSVIWRPLLQLIFPLGFHRTTRMTVVTKSGKVTKPYTAEEQAKIDRRLKEKKEEKAKKMEEELKKKMEEEKRKIEEEMRKQLEEEKKKIEEEEEKLELCVQAGEQGMVEYVLPRAEEAGCSYESALKLDQEDAAIWAAHFDFEPERPEDETKEEIEAFEAQLQLVDEEEWAIMIEERETLIKTRLAAQKRREYGEKKRLKEEGEAINERTATYAVQIEELAAKKIARTITEERALSGSGKVVGGGEPIKREKIKVKLPDTYFGKKEENFDRWESTVQSYAYAQCIPEEDKVLMAHSCLGGAPADFALSLANAAGCGHDMVAYSKRTALRTFLDALPNRFEDKTKAMRTADKLNNIHLRKWKSVSALKATMDELLQTPDHGLTPEQILNNFARALPDPIKSNLYAKVKEDGMTYDQFSKMAVDQAGFLQEANCHWYKDLEKGKHWKGKTIAGSITGKDNLVVTFEEGGCEALTYDQIEYGLDEGSGEVQGGDFAAVVRGGGRGGRGGRGRGGRGWGGRGRGYQGECSNGGCAEGGRGYGPPQGSTG